MAKVVAQQKNVVDKINQITVDLCFAVNPTLTKEELKARQQNYKPVAEAALAFSQNQNLTEGDQNKFKAILDTTVNWELAQNLRLRDNKPYAETKYYVDYADTQAQRDVIDICEALKTSFPRGQQNHDKLRDVVDKYNKQKRQDLGIAEPSQIQASMLPQPYSTNQSAAVDLCFAVNPTLTQEMFEARQQNYKPLAGAAATFLKNPTPDNQAKLKKILDSAVNWELAQPLSDKYYTKKDSAAMAQLAVTDICNVLSTSFPNGEKNHDKLKIFVNDYSKQKRKELEIVPRLNRALLGAIPQNSTSFDIIEACDNIALAAVVLANDPTSQAMQEKLTKARILIPEAHKPKILEALKKNVSETVYRSIEQSLSPPQMQTSMQAAPRSAGQSASSSAQQVVGEYYDDPGTLNPASQPTPTNSSARTIPNNRQSKDQDEEYFQDPTLHSASQSVTLTNSNASTSDHSRSSKEPNKEYFKDSKHDKENLAAKARQKLKQSGIQLDPSPSVSVPRIPVSTNPKQGSKRKWYNFFSHGRTP